MVISSGRHYRSHLKKALGKNCLATTSIYTLEAVVSILKGYNWLKHVILSRSNPNIVQHLAVDTTEFSCRPYEWW